MVQSNSSKIEKVFIGLICITVASTMIGIWSPSSNQSYAYVALFSGVVAAGIFIYAAFFRR